MFNGNSSMLPLLSEVRAKVRSSVEETLWTFKKEYVIQPKDKTMKPTVIGNGGGKKPAVQPTVIGGMVDQEQTPLPHPTVIKTAGDEKERNAQPIQPTVINGGEPEKKEEPRNQKPTVIQKKGPTTIIGRECDDVSSVVVRKPTTVPGYVPKRIDLSSDELKKGHALTEDRVLARAVEIVRHVCVEEFSERDAVMWGHEVQARYSTLVSEGLALIQDEVLGKVAGYLNRMTVILSSINLKKICGMEATSGILKRFLSAEDGEIATMKELQEAQRELGQILNLMSEKLSGLLLLKTRIEENSKKIDELGEELEALSIAASSVADYFAHEKQKGDFAQRIEERSASLVQTQAQIRASDCFRRAQVEQPLRLIGMVQQTALVTVPGWISAAVTLKTALEGSRRPTVTEVDELGDQVRSIVSKLRGEG